jgi:hypothetical protein
MGAMTENRERKQLPRPRQVTTAALAAVVGSVVLVFSLVDTLGRLRTPETRASVDDFLADGPGSGLGVETAQVVDAMRGLAYVSGALAAAALVFAVFVLQQHRGARVGLTVAAGLLLLTIPVTGLLPLLIAAGAAMVWSRPARDWYAGRQPASASAASTGLLSEPDEPPRPWQPPAQQPHQPPAQPPYQPPYQPPQPDPYQQPYDPYQQQPPVPDSGKRPVTVTIACVLTWVGSSLVIAMSLLLALLLATSRDFLIEEIDRAARDAQVVLDSEGVVAVVWSAVAVFLFWSLVAVVLAVLAFRRSNAARIVLAISAVMTALLSLLTITSGVSIITLLLGAAATVLLFTGGANGWYARRGAGRPGGERPNPW